MKWRNTNTTLARMRRILSRSASIQTGPSYSQIMPSWGETSTEISRGLQRSAWRGFRLCVASCGTDISLANQQRNGGLLLRFRFQHEHWKGNKSKPKSALPFGFIEEGCQGCPRSTSPPYRQPPHLQAPSQQSLGAIDYKQAAYPVSFLAQSTRIHISD